MNQAFKKLPPIRMLFIAFSIAMAIVPAAVLSVLLIITLQADLEKNGYDFAQFQANLLADRMSSELETLTTDLIKVAADNDVSAAARSSVFADNALEKIENSLLNSDLDSGVIIFDRNWESTEASPIEWLLVDTNVFKPSNDSIASKQGDIQFRLVNLPVPDKEQQRNSPTLVFYTPLHLDTLIEAPASTHTGTLALLRPVSSFVKSISDNALQASLLSLELNGVNIYKSNELPSGFIRNESIRSINGNLNLSVEMGVPFAPIKDQVKQYTIKLTMGLIAALIAISLISFVGIWKLLSPYQEVTKAVEKLSLGNYHQIDTELRFREPAQIIDLLNVLQHRVIRDQSELEDMVKKRTQQLSSANQELEKTLKEVQNLQEHLVESEKNAQLGKLVSGVAHEINTPIGNSLTALSILSEQLVNLNSKFDAGTLTSDEMRVHLQTCQEALPLVESNLQRSASLVRTFKEVSVENVTGNRRAFYVGSYLNEVFSTLSTEIDKYNVTVEITGDESLQIFSDAGALGRVISQLILNSLKHGFKQDEDHHIALNYQAKQDHIVLTFKDDGRGADKETIERIFEPFYTTERYAGHIGLGLHIVYNVVCQKLNGSITVAQLPGTNGLLFTITFPVDNEVL